MNLGEAKELHAPIGILNREISKGIDDFWTADTLIMDQYSDETKQGFKYILNVIDTFLNMFSQYTYEN